MGVPSNLQKGAGFARERSVQSVLPCNAPLSCFRHAQQGHALPTPLKSAPPCDGPPSAAPPRRMCSCYRTGPLSVSVNRRQLRSRSAYGGHLHLRRWRILRPLCLSVEGGVCAGILQLHLSPSSTTGGSRRSAGRQRRAGDGNGECSRTQAGCRWIGRGVV